MTTPNIPDPAAIDPPQGWELDDPLGFFMAYKEGNAGQLVRLADLLRWLQQTRSIPRAAAVDVLCDALPLDVMGWLYRVDAIHHAKPVPIDAQFGYKTAVQIAEADAAQARDEDRQRHSGEFGDSWGWSNRDWWQSPRLYVAEGKATTNPPQPTEPGRPSLLRLIRWLALSKKKTKDVCEPMDHQRSLLAPLAIPVIKAHALWGYGTVQQQVAAASPVAASADQPQRQATYAALVAVRNADKTAPWGDEWPRVLADEIDARKGQKGVRAGIAKELGMTVSGVGDVLTRAKARAKRTKRLPASAGLPAANVFELGQKTG